MWKGKAMQRFFSFLAGLLSGAIVGAVAALLLAPMSGEELISEARTRADGLVTDVKTAIADERKRLEAEFEALKRGEIQVA
jgi:gas vesicle protein